MTKQAQIEALRKAEKSIYDTRRYNEKDSIWGTDWGEQRGLIKAELILRRHIAKLKGK
jgi:hypothetical protein